MRDDSAYLKDILDAIQDIQQFTSNIIKDQFIKNKEKQYAVIRAIEIIGEAVKNVSRRLKTKHPDIEWREIAGMRDKLIHSYFGVDKNLVWSTIEIDIPKLKSSILDILKNFE